jgi:hypothetical protein
LDVVHDLVKPAVVEELCQLLILVAGEAADKQQQQHDGSANGTVPNGAEQQHEGPVPAAAGKEPAKAAAVKVEQDADGDSAMQEAEQQQQRSSPTAAADAGADAAEYSTCYAAQEAVVLQEFNSILQRIISQAEKKSSVAAATAAAAAAAAAGQEQAAASSGMEASEQQQQLQQQPKAVVSAVRLAACLMMAEWRSQSHNRVDFEPALVLLVTPSVAGSFVCMLRVNLHLSSH